MLNMFNEYTYGNAMRKQVGNKRIVGFPGKNEPSFHTCISIFISFLIKLRFCMFLYVVVLTVRPVVSASDQYKPTGPLYSKMCIIRCLCRTIFQQYTTACSFSGGLKFSGYRCPCFVCVRYPCRWFSKKIMSLSVSTEL